MTATELKNAALILIGAQTVSDYTTSTTREAVLINALYDTFIEKVLCLRKWSFATKRASLTDETVVTSDEFNYSFALPSGFLNLITVYQDSTYKSVYSNYNINDNKIYANKDAIYIKYIYKAAETQFSPAFRQFVIYALASEICYNLTGQQTLTDRLVQMAYGLPSDNMNGGLLGVASRIDAHQNMPKVIYDDPITASRLAGI